MVQRLGLRKTKLKRWLHAEKAFLTYEKQLKDLSIHISFRSPPNFKMISFWKTTIMQYSFQHGFIWAVLPFFYHIFLHNMSWLLLNCQSCYKFKGKIILYNEGKWWITITSSEIMWPSYKKPRMFEVEATQVHSYWASDAAWSAAH